LRGGVAGFLGVGHDVFNSGAGLRDFSLVVQLVGIVKLLLCDPYAHFRAVFGGAPSQSAP